MKLKKQFKLDRAASKELLRQTLNHIRIDGNEAIATDGHVLARVPVELDATEPNSISVHVNAWKEATKRKKTDDMTICSDKAIVGKQSFHHPEEQEYPDWKKVWPKPYKRYVEVGLNAQLLLYLAQALAAGRVSREADNTDR